MKWIAGICVALAISTVGLFAEVRPVTQGVTPGARAQAEEPKQEITVTGCIRTWKPAPEDITRYPDNDRPGVAGVYLLTPVHSAPTTAADLPTYLLTPTQLVNFAQHLDDMVEVVGVTQAAPTPATFQEVRNTPSRPENIPNAQSMPRFTISALRKISDSCP